MATATLAKLPESDRPYDGALIENLTELVEKAEKPKPPQPDRSTIVTPGDAGSSENEEDRRQRNAAMLHELCAFGERMAAQAFELTYPKADPLAIALNGFPDVNTSLASYARMR